MTAIQTQGGCVVNPWNPCDDVEHLLDRVVGSEWERVGSQPASGISLMADWNVPAGMYRVMATSHGNSGAWSIPVPELPRDHGLIVVLILLAVLAKRSKK